MNSTVITNWAGNITFGHTELAEPSCLSELRSIVGRAERVRVLGGGHSFCPIADTPGTLLSLSRLPGEPELDSEAGRVRVPAGYSYAALVSWLDGTGWTVPNMASLPHIFVVGACCTATHGSGDQNGNLATAVSALTLVTADGELLTLDRDSADFEGAVVSLGALGVVTDVTLDLVPAFEVRQQLYEGLSLDALADNFDAISSAAYSVSVFPISWGDPIEQVWLKRRDEDAPVARQWYGTYPADGPRSPIPGQDPATCTEQLGIPGPAHTRLPHFRPDVSPSAGSELQSEYLVPREHAVGAIRAVHAMRDRIAPLSWCSEVRTIASDRLWLSPAYGQDVVGLHFTWRYDPAAVTAALPELERALEPHQPVPHWGKLHTLDAEHVRARYPRLSDFVDLARRLDPHGTFRNAYLDRYVFGGS